MSGIDFADIERMVRQQREAAQKLNQADANDDEKTQTPVTESNHNRSVSTVASKPIQQLPDTPKISDIDTANKKEKQTDIESSKRKSINGSADKSVRKRSEFVYLRDMPKGIVGEARRVFSTASNNTDAVAAYIAYKSGVRDGLSDVQLELLKTTKVEDPVVELNKRISSIQQTMINMVSMMQELEIAMSYMIFDRLGFRQENPDVPRQINMNEPGMVDVIDRVREMSRQMHQQEVRRKGRPIR